MNHAQVRDQLRTIRRLLTPEDPDDGEASWANLPSLANMEEAQRILIGLVVDRHGGHGIVRPRMATRAGIEAAEKALDDGYLFLSDNIDESDSFRRP